MEEYRFLVNKLDYDFDAWENRNVLHMHLPTTCKFFLGVFGNCLTNKTRSLDHVKSFKQHILFFLFKNKKLDFARLILDQIVEIIQGSKIYIHVLYCLRWFLIILILGMMMFKLRICLILYSIQSCSTRILMTNEHYKANVKVDQRSILVWKIAIYCSDNGWWDAIWWPSI